MHTHHQDVRCHVYVTNPESPQYCPGLSLEERAELVRNGVGSRGTSLVRIHARAQKAVLTLHMYGSDRVMPSQQQRPMSNN